MRGLISALVSSILLFFAFPDWNQSYLVWIALVPLLVALHGAGMLAAFILSMVAGICFIMLLCHWTNAVDEFRWLDFILSSSYFGFYFGIFGVLFRSSSKLTKVSATFTAPVLWVTVEFLRSNAGALALPWGLLGHSQYRELPIIQIASITGVAGVSFLIMMVNGALADMWLRVSAPSFDIRATEYIRALFLLILPVPLVGIVFLLGSYVLSRGGNPDNLKITVVQPNIAQALKWNPALLRNHFDAHVRLSEMAASQESSSLIVWPEGAVEGFVIRDLSLQRAVNDLAIKTGAHLLIGSAQRPKFGSREFRRRQLYNSAVLVSPSLGIVQEYHKIRLLPFAEYLPGNEFFPWPARYVSGAGNFLPGRDYTLFDVNATKFGVVICWESIFPDHFRAFVKHGARFMVNITNEAWFDDSSAPYQFLSMAVFRAVENRVSVVRSANSGISGFIDPYGRIQKTVQINGKQTFVSGYATDGIALPADKTFYTRYGDLFALGCVAGSLWLFLKVLYSSRREGAGWR